MEIGKNTSFLVDNWDVVPTVSDGLDKCPIIENKGIEALREFVYRKNVGSFLLSGQRGSGKTTSITHLLKEIDKDTCLMIFLDAIYLEATENDHQKEDKLLQILRQLIRSLIKELEVRGYKIPNELNELKYDLKATEIERLQKTSLAIGQKASFGANGKLFGDIVGSNMSVYEEGKSNTSKLNKTIGFTIEGLADNFSKVISDLEDNKLKKKGMPEIEFKKIKNLPGFIKLPKLKERKSINKIIFIVDELDAYDTEPKNVLDVIKKFKNLFTLSKAQFIFIVGEETYKTVLIDDTFRTLFTEKYFLPKPNGDDLSLFLDSIVLNKKEITSNLDWKQFKWYVISLSHHNFYELIQEIRSYTKYDKKSNKTKINIGKLSFQEGIRASVHYALNEVYKYHLNDRAYCHCDNVLFDELSLIEKSLLDWLLNKKDTLISLKPSSKNYSDNIEIEPKIRIAKLFFLRYLHRLADIPIADNFGDGVDEVKVDWNSLLVGLSSFEVVVKGVKGVITPNENEIFKNIDDINRKLSTVLELFKQKTNNGNFSQLVKSSMECINFSYPDDYLNSIDTTIKQIKNKLLYERNPEDTKNSLELVKNLSAILENFHIMPSNNIFRKGLSDGFVFKSDWGDIQQNRLSGEIVLGNNSSHGNKLLSRMTIYSPNKTDDKPLEITYKVKIREDSLINFLINTKNNGSELEDEFYMVRVDTRKNMSIYSILLKSENDPNWNIITDTPFATVTKIKPNKWVDIKIIISNKKIELYQKNRRNFFKSLECKFDRQIENFGFGNELGQVEIKNINIKSLSKIN